MLNDFARGLDACPATKLGFVVTGVDERKLYGTSSYGYQTKADKNEADVPTPLRRATSSGR